MAELHIENLRVTYPTPDGPVDVVRDLSLTMGAERIGIVGESGSGKSMTARAILGLIRPPGQVQAKALRYDRQDLLALNAKGWRALRGRHIGMVLQDPKFSLNPVMRVGKQIAEAALLHKVFPPSQARERVMEMLHTVGISAPERVYQAYPHELSGGIGQRVMIAAMMMAAPSLLIADEPTSALDVMVRNQVLELMDGEIRKRGMGLLMISHDLSMVARFCDRVLVMYRGQVVESCAASDLPHSRHPYTQGLLNCLPTGGHAGQPLPVMDRAAIENALHHGP